MLPLKNSNLFVWKLYPNVPALGFAGLPALFHDGILGFPIRVESPFPISINRGAFLCLIGSVSAHKYELVECVLLRFFDNSAFVV